MSVDKVTIPIERLQNLVNNSNYQIVVLRDSADFTYFSEATDTNRNARLVYEQMIKGKTFVVKAVFFLKKKNP